MTYDLAVTPNGRPADASPLGKGKRKLSDYEREIAHALIRKGHPKSEAIAMARGLLKKAAATGRWGRGKAGAKTRGGAVASIAQRKDFSNLDLAGFNPSEPRAAGMWTKGAGQAGKGKPVTAVDNNRKAMLAQRARLQAEVKHLHAVLASITSGGPKKGVHKGQATGKQSGPKGGKAAKGGGKASAPAAKAGKGPDLATQIANLQTEVKHLKRQILKARVARG